MPPYGGWEAGTVDRHGRKWVHQPWQGWRLADRKPYLSGHVYTSRAVRHTARQDRLTRWAAAPVLLGSAALITFGLYHVEPLLAAAGTALAATLAGVLRWGARDGRR